MAFIGVVFTGEELDVDAVLLLPSDLPRELTYLKTKYPDVPSTRRRSKRITASLSTPREAFF